jgi:hypothetical protein
MHLLAISRLAPASTQPDATDKAVYTRKMNSNHKKSILWSLVFALAMIASAFLFKGNPALYWIEAALTVAALALVILKPQRPARVH